MASTQNYYDHYIPFFPQPPPHNDHPIPPKVTPPHSSPPSPPNVAPPHHSPPVMPPPGHPLTPPHNVPSPPKVPPPFHPIISSPPPPFPVPATPPTHSFHPPPPAAKPPSHSPPHPPFLPPPPSAPSGHHSSVIVIVFVSLGGLFFLAFLSAALFCFLKKKKKVEKSELVHVDEHVKVEEAIISGPHGEEVKVVTIEDDVHIQEEVDKKSVVEAEGIHKQLAHEIPQDHNSKASISGSNLQDQKA